MNKILEIIIAASVLSLLLVVIMSTTTDALQSASDTTNKTKTNTKCQIQSREAERSNNPSILSEECVKYAEPSLQEKWEEQNVIDDIT